MKLLSRTRLLFLFFLMTVSIPAYAFPLADSVSGISSLIGVISSVIAGIFPSLKKSKSASFMLLSAIGLLFVVVVLSSFIIYESNINKSEIDIVRQSRPESFLTKDTQEREKIQHLEFGKEDIDFFNSYHLSKKLISLSDFKSIPKDKYIEPINIDFNPNFTTYQTDIVKGFKIGDFDSVSAYVKKRNGRIMLAGGSVKDRVRVAREVFNRSGILVNILKDENIVYSYLNRSSSDSIPYLSGNFDIFSLNSIYDLRVKESIKQARTIFNAEIATIMDLALLPNWKLREIFGNNESVFVDYYEDTYVAANAILKDANVEGYHFIRGGLKKHFKDGYGLVPNYYNERIIDPFILMDIVKSTDKVKFICTNNSICSNNIPKEMQVNIPYAEMEIPAFNREIRNLSKDFLYVTLSSNQETTGEALTVGYLLISSGHQYLGELPLFERFSIEKIRHQIGRSWTYDTSLDEYREKTVSIADYTPIMHKIINYFGWAFSFFFIGCLLRLICTPLQLPVYRSYYFLKTDNTLRLLMSMLTPVIIIIGYFKIDYLISYYGIIDHSLMNNLKNEGNGFMISIFMALVSFQALISFPKRKLIAYGIISSLFLLYLFGYMDNMPKPLLSFLIGSEVVSLLFQMPFYFSYLSNKSDEEKGFTYKAIIDNSFGYPDKWKLLNFFDEKTPGVLIDTNISPDEWDSVYSQVQSRKIIVRSCSDSYLEQSLGGYFQSFIHDSSLDSYRSIVKLSNMGCSHAFIQPYIGCAQTGVASSLSSDGKGVFYALGAPEAATEGFRNISNGIIRRKGKVDNSFKRELRDLVLKIEKFYSSPISIEFGVSHDDRPILFQIRINDHKGVNKLYPLTINDYSIAESFLAKCSILTGEMLEHVTRNNFLYINGFMYQKNKPSIRKVLFTENQYYDLKEKIESNIEDTLSSSIHSPLWHQEKLIEAINLYQKIYDASMSKISPNGMLNLSKYRCVQNSESPELLISGRKEVEEINQSKRADSRDSLHLLLTLASYIINFHIRKILLIDTLPSNISFKSLISGDKSDLYVIDHHAKYPLMEKRTDETLVEGPINGIPVSSDMPVTEFLSLSGSLVLVGEEISSDWVRYLDRFSGIVSVYGHELSHLCISANKLNIPYRKIDQEALSKIIDSNIVNIE